MDVLTGSADFARFVADRLNRASSFRLVDIGCSNGVHAAFRSFGQRLTAWAFDIDSDECNRLQTAETLPGIRYIAGNVGLPEGHPFLAARDGRSPYSGNPWERLSVAETLRHRSARPAPPAAAPADPSGSGNRIDLAGFLVSEEINDLDFIKIDVDGEDFAILSGLDDRLADLGFPGVGIEVNFFGTDHPTDNTLHNVDRFMRRQGYDLFGLTTRHYSAAALPSRYIYWFATETEFGRLLQGDALYMRDFCAPGCRELAEQLPPAKLLKAAATFALGNLPDCAAEILVTFRDRLSSLVDIDAALDLLGATIRSGDMPARYRDYRAAFVADAPCFYTPDPNQRTLPLTPVVTDPGSGLSRESKATCATANDVLADNLRLRDELRAFRASTSWRITAPLRWLARKAGRT